jgi:hypothetical protein
MIAKHYTPPFLSDRNVLNTSLPFTASVVCNKPGDYRDDISFSLPSLSFRPPSRNPSTRYGSENDSETDPETSLPAGRQVQDDISRNDI